MLEAVHPRTRKVTLAPCADAWGLYTEMDGVDAAAETMVTRIEEIINRFGWGVYARDLVRGVQVEFSRWGANDTCVDESIDAMFRYLNGEED